MPDYQKTKIYRIVVGGRNYYGHTTQPLYKRKWEHRKHFNKYPDRKIYKAIRDAGMSVDDIELIWVEDFPCENVNQARARERYWVERDGTLNNNIPNRSQKEYQKVQENKDRRNQLNSERKAKDETYRLKVSEYNRLFMRRKRANKEYKNKLKLQRKKEYNENRDKLLEIQRERIKCDVCGIEMNRSSLSRHKKRKHKSMIIL